MSFARTKIQAPRSRPGWVATACARSPARRGAAAAPAGAVQRAGRLRQDRGTDAADRAAAAGSALAWVSCDEDDDLQRLLGCICAALEPFDPPWRSDPDTLAARAAGTRAQRREAADELLNVLAACEVAARRDRARRPAPHPGPRRVRVHRPAAAGRCRRTGCWCCPAARRRRWRWRGCVCRASWPSSARSTCSSTLSRSRRCCRPRPVPRSAWRHRSCWRARRAGRWACAWR